MEIPYYKLLEETGDALLLESGDFLLFDSVIKDSINITENIVVFLVEGPNSPTAASQSDIIGGPGSAQGWSNINNIFLNDGSSATGGMAPNQHTTTIVGSGFGFSVPTGSIISGIVLQIKGSATGAPGGVGLTKTTTTLAGSTKDPQFPWSSTYKTFGSSTDLWGTTWVPSEINSANFGGLFSAASLNTGGASFSIDHMQITVFYSFPECSDTLNITENINILLYDGDIIKNDVINVTENTSLIKFDSRIFPSKNTYYGTAFNAGPNNGSPTFYLGGFSDTYYDFFQFDITGGPVVKDTESVFLVLYSLTAPTNTPTPIVKRVTSTWDETTLTRTNTPTIDSTSYSFSPAWGTNIGWKYCDITTLYKQWKGGTYTNFGVRVEPTLTNNTSLSVPSSYYTDDTALIPFLLVTQISLLVNVSDILNITENLTTNLVYPYSLLTIIDFWNFYSGTVDPLYNSSGGWVEIGQTFTSPDPSILYECDFDLQRLGNPTGFLVAKLYEMSGTYGVSGVPTGSALAVSDSIDVTQLSTSLTVVPFFFNGINRIPLLGSNHHYVITLDSSNTTSNASNLIYLGEDDRSGSNHGGNPVERLFGSSSWDGTTYSGVYDLVFFVYGIELNISVSDSINVTESDSLVNSQNESISVSDTLNISESTPQSLPLVGILVSDSINITQNVIVNTQTSSVSVFETVNITENVIKTLQSFLNVSDSINITENVTKDNQFNIFVSDSVNITQNVTITNSSLGDISVFSTLNISEHIELIALTPFETNKSDSIIVSENINVTNTPESINVNDTINQQISFFSIWEDIKMYTQLGNIVVSETINITENTNETKLSDIVVFDSINITESLSSYVQLGDINEIDIIYFLDVLNSQQINYVLFVSVFDLININDFATGEGPLNINVSNSILISENAPAPSVFYDIRVNIFDSIVSTELILIESFRFSASPGNSQPQGNLFVFKSIATASNGSFASPVGTINNNRSPVSSKGMSL